MAICRHPISFWPISKHPGPNDEKSNRYQNYQCHVWNLWAQAPMTSWSLVVESMPRPKVVQVKGKNGVTI